MTEQHTWHAKPDRTNDPAIKRNVFSRAAIKFAEYKTKGRSYQFMRVLAINGRLHFPYLIWNSRVMPEGKLTRQQTEVVIIRVAWLCQSEYEWTQHKAIGMHNGLSKEQVEAAGPDPTSDLFDDEFKALLAGVPELIENHVLSDESFDALSAYLRIHHARRYLLSTGRCLEHIRRPDRRRLAQGRLVPAT
jgi:alkylhydroperoxidase family enzyme